MGMNFLRWALIGALSPGVPAPPRLTVSPAGQVELGSVGPAEVIRQGYVFRNTSRAPISLRVLDLTPGVSAAGPALERPIPPLGSAALVLAVDASGWVGPLARNVRLGTDDPAQGRYYLPTRLTVRPDLTVDGVKRTFGAVGPQESPRTVFTFVRETGHALLLRVATPLPDYLESEVEVRGGRGEVAFTLRAARVPPGMAAGLEQVRVETNAPLQPRFDLYLDWQVRHPIEAIPGRVVFLDPATAALELALKARNGKPFRVLGASLEGRGFQLGSLPPAAAPVQRLTIHRSASGAAKALLVIRCEGEEPLKVPVAYLPAQ